MISIKPHPTLPGLATLSIWGPEQDFARDLEIVRRLPGIYYDRDAKVSVAAYRFLIPLYEHYGKRYDWQIPKHVLYNEPEPKVELEFPIEAEEARYFKGEILDFQTISACFLYYLKRRICADDVGTGKTSTAIRAALKGMRVHKDIKQALILTRASVKYQWANEINRFTDCSNIIINGTLKQRRKQWETAFAEEREFVICNWEQLLNEDFQYMKSKKWDLIIGDEAHLVANSSAERSKAFAKLDSEYLWLLTATPINGKADRAYTLINYLYKGVLGKKTEFERDYCIKDSRFGWAIIGSKNMPDLKYRIAPYILRREQKEVADSLPDIVYKDYFVEMTPVQNRILVAINEQLLDAQSQLDSLDPSADDFAAEYERLSGMCQGLLNLQIEVIDHPKLLAMSDSYLVRNLVSDEKDLSKSPKLTELLTLIEERVELGHKVIVFTEFARMAQLIAEAIAKHKSLKGITSAMLVGQMAKGCTHESTQACGDCSSYKQCNTRRKSQWRFWNEPNCMVFITTAAGAEGINLQNAKHLINYDLPWDPSKWDQRTGRISRIGATHQKVVVSNLIMQNSIDEAILRTHHRKRNVIDTLIDKTVSEKEWLDTLLCELRTKQS